MPRNAAERIANPNGEMGFKASEGWLAKVKGHHGISGIALSGEGTAVDKVHSVEIRRNRQNFQRLFSQFIFSLLYFNINR